MFADVGNVPAVMQTGSGEGAAAAGMFGASGMWIFALVIIFFALAFFGGGGFGGRRDVVDNATLGAPAAAFTELNARLDSIQREVGHNNDLAELRALYTQACATDMNVTQQAFNVSNLINQTRTDTLLNLKDAALQQANCCCEIRRDIDGVKFQQAQDTCAIINASNANATRILDKMCETEITRLRDELSKERLAASQLKQDLFIERQGDKVINSLKIPSPIPAYPSIPANMPVSPAIYGGIGTVMV